MSPQVRGGIGILLIIGLFWLGSGCNRRTQSSPVPPPVSSLGTPSPSIRPSTPTAAETAKTRMRALLAAWKPRAVQYERAKRSPKRVALTFDAGSDAAAVPLILKTLEARQIKATFFLTGRFCEQFPQECRAIAKAGMELGNHSYSHPHFTRLKDKQVLEQLTRTEATIQKVCGRGARPLFRFPFGDSDQRTRTLVAKARYQPIYWTVDSLDSVGQPKTADFVAQRLKKKLTDGSISLMHVSSVGSAKALPNLLAWLDKKGWKVVPVSELMLHDLEKPKAVKVASTKNPSKLETK